MISDMRLTQQGHERPINGMYKSSILKRGIEALYMTPPWRTAIKLPWFKDDDWEPTPGPFVPNEESYAFRPPVSFVAFVASAVSLFNQLTLHH